MDLVYTDYLGINIHSQKDSESNATNDSDNNIEYMPHSTVYKQPNYDILRLNPLSNHIYNTYTHQTLGQFITTITTTNTTPNSNNTSIASPIYTQDLTTSFLNEGVKEEEEDAMDWATAIYLSTNKPEFTSTITSNTIATTPISSTTATCTETSTAASSANTYTSAENSTNTINSIKINYLRNIHRRLAVRIPRLSEICYKKVAESAVYVTEEMAKLGGSRPDVPWMQVYFICCVVYCVLIYRIIM